MKVYELIYELQKAQAGAEVVVCMNSTLNASVESVYIGRRVCDVFGEVTITGGDAQLISEDGVELGYLSELSAKGE